MTETIGQIIGFIAMFLCVMSYQAKSAHAIRLIQIVMSFFWVIHFILLGKYTGAVINGVGLVRTIIFFFRGKKWADNIFWLYFFIAAFIVTGIITWESWLSLLCVVAMIFGTLSLYMTDPKLVRIFALGCCPLWLIYDAFAHSYAGVLNEAVTIVSIIVALIRYKKKTVVPKETDDSSINSSDVK